MCIRDRAKRLRAFSEKYNVRKDGFVLERALEHEGVVSENEGLPSQACFIVPIAAARCMSTAPTMARGFLNIPCLLYTSRCV